MPGVILQCKAYLANLGQQQQPQEQPPMPNITSTIVRPIPNKIQLWKPWMYSASLYQDWLTRYKSKIPWNYIYSCYIFHTKISWKCRHFASQFHEKINIFLPGWHHHPHLTPPQQLNWNILLNIWIFHPLLWPIRIILIIPRFKFLIILILNQLQIRLQRLGQQQNK